MGAEAGYATGTVGRTLHVLVYQPLVPELFDDPPAGLDIGVVQGDVWVVHVHPEGDPFGHALPLADIPEHAFSAAAVELLNAVAFDLTLGGETQLPLHLQLHRQSMSVPAAFAKALETLHGLVAADDVLEHPCQHMMNAGHAVGSGRALIEHEAGASLPLPLRTAEDILVFPELQNTLLHLGKADSAGHRFEHARPQG